jgi:UPF0716 protein FxsA
VGLVVLLLIIGVPIAELYVFVQMSHGIGFLDSLVILGAVSVIGAWIVKRQGIRVWRRFNSQVRAGATPSNEIVDGALLLAAGALLLTPGFITDAIGILLLLPPVRAVVRAVVKRRNRSGQVITATYSGPLRYPDRPSQHGVIDVGSDERD